MKKTIYLLVSLFLLSCSAQQEWTPETQPNIILIMSDDHAYQAISAYDSSRIKTPHIDRLADEGMLFTSAYVTNSICSPSRAVALTGKFSHLNSVRDNIDRFDSSQVTFPKLLQQAGYETAAYGKWHLKSAPTGFDYWKVLPGQGQYYHPEFKTEEGIVKEEGYVTDLITDFAISYLDSLRDNSKPFFMMYNHKAPHREWWPSMQDLEEFKYHKIPVPETLFDEYQNRGRAAKEAEMRIHDHMALTADNKIAPEIVKALNFEDFLDWYETNYTHKINRLSPEEREQWMRIYGPINEDFRDNTPRGKALTMWKYQRYMEDYLGTIISVDRNIGRLLDHLDEQGLSNNTMVIYTSDQGFYLGEHGWFDKRFMYEESFRTPLLIRYPQMIKKASVNRDMVQNIDLAPTILEAAGAAVPDDMQGLSMIPLLQQKEGNWRDELYYHYYEYPGIHMVKRHYGIRTDRYKLIHFYYDIDEWELYDLEVDPQEMNNVYADEAYADIREELHERLKKLRAFYKDSEELDRQFLEKDLARLEAMGWN